MVPGMDATILYGEDTNLNGVLDPNEDDGDKAPPSDNSDGKLDPGLLEYVTVFSKQPANGSDGTPRLDVTRPGFREAIVPVLKDKLGDTRATAIHDGISPSDRFDSPLGFFVTASTGSAAMTADEFNQIAGSLTTTHTPGLYPNPVNVNTASDTVLACIPGIGPDKASALISARTARAEYDSSIAWVVDTLGPDGARQAGAYITGESWQFTVDVAAVGHNGRGYRRTKFVIDTASGTPQIIYRRNLSGLGWALGTDVRQSLASSKGAK